MAGTKIRTASIIGLILIAGMIPILWYWFFARSPLAASLEPISGFSSLSPSSLSPSSKEMSLFEQFTAVIGGFILKPFHMILSLLIIWALLRLRAPDMVALRRGLFFFLLGESFCAANYLIFNHQSNLAEYLHSYGMVIGFAFTFYALFEGLDSRLIQISDRRKKCAMVELCGKCAKSQEVPCGARRMILALLAVFLILSALPLAANLHPVHYTTEIFGTSYTYSWPLLHQLFEARYAPVVAMILLAAALITMLVNRRAAAPVAARILASAGLGYMAFGLLRFMLKTFFRDNLVWADFWEELTELIFVLSIAVILLLFLQRLFREAFPKEHAIKASEILRFPSPSGNLPQPR